jgi:hypothetical protein
MTWLVLLDGAFGLFSDFVFFVLTQYVPGSTTRCQSPDIFLALLEFGNVLRMGPHWRTSLLCMRNEGRVFQCGPSFSSLSNFSQRWGREETWHLRLDGWPDSLFCVVRVVGRPDYLPSKLTTQKRLSVLLSTSSSLPRGEFTTWARMISWLNCCLTNLMQFVRQ